MVTFLSNNMTQQQLKGKIQSRSFSEMDVHASQMGCLSCYNIWEFLE